MTGQKWAYDSDGKLAEMKQVDSRTRAEYGEKHAESAVRGAAEGEEPLRIAQYEEKSGQFFARERQATEKDKVIYQRVQVVMVDVPPNRVILEEVNHKWQAMQDRAEPAARQAGAGDRIELRGTNDFTVTLAEEEYIRFIRALSAIGEIYMGPIYSGTLMDEPVFARLLDSLDTALPRDEESGISRQELDKKAMEAALKAQGPEAVEGLKKLALMYNNYDLNVVSSKAMASEAEIKAREADVSETEK